VIGIGYWETAVCGKDAKAIAKAIRYTANLVGVDHVGLGSDFDGAVAQPFDTRGLVQITDALLADGFTDEEIGQIMGRNVLRLLIQSLP
jgi:microsomal dipeptidase-like Zn-dependent dipeptidase